jgi:dethiobiotin synthetase
VTAKRVFLAATGQNRGKTTTSLGLLAAIRDRGLRLGFVKPVGQRYLVVDGTRADEDAVFMQSVFALPDALDDMSPVTLPRHFTTDFIMGRIGGDLGAEVIAACDRVAADKDVVVIEAPVMRASARWWGSRMRGRRRSSSRRSSSSARAASGGPSTRSC